MKGCDGIAPPRQSRAKWLIASGKGASYLSARALANRRA
ncbi:hypothetical protein BSIN_4405 [Burkholderia singularis]|uniref:Uncharacterized protein n=1 Tax=Burkholderia singularis TaxID=1503053 RepID=A0A238H8W8_9BURK|nr:hypothetical protein BSIN_4405 [Burkholderia singularis]